MNNVLNKNLRIINSQTYQGIPVYQHANGLIEDYLLRIIRLVKHSHQSYGRLLVVRCDLRIPSYFDPEINIIDNSVMTRFIASLKAKLDSKILQASREGKRAHPHGLSYVWVREQHNSIHPHYHVALTLNGHAYQSIGNMADIGENCLATKISSAWSSALGITHISNNGLVHFCSVENQQTLNPQSPISPVMQQLSYLCKVDTKVFGDGQRNFGCSQVPSTMPAPQTAMFQ